MMHVQVVCYCCISLRLVTMLVPDPPTVSNYKVALVLVVFVFHFPVQTLHMCSCMVVTLYNLRAGATQNEIGTKNKWAISLMTFVKSTNNMETQKLRLWARMISNNLHESTRWATKRIPRLITSKAAKQPNQDSMHDTVVVDANFKAFHFAGSWQFHIRRMIVLR